MITDEHWINFIKSFFGIKEPQEWIHHVTSNWNHLKNEPGCNCRYRQTTLGHEIVLCEYWGSSIELELGTTPVRFATIEENDLEPYTWDSFKSS